MKSRLYKISLFIIMLLLTSFMFYIFYEADSILDVKNNILKIKYYIYNHVFN